MAVLLVLGSDLSLTIPECLGGGRVEGLVLVAMQGGLVSTSPVHVHACMALASACFGGCITIAAFSGVNWLLLPVYTTSCTASTQCVLHYLGLILPQLLPGF